jgi:hypothetical protein
MSPSTYYPLSLEDGLILTVRSYQVHYDLVITMESALMKFSAEFKGKEMGSVQPDYSK